MTPKVSIIVPCYGVEKYLDYCMESLVNQTLIDIEIVLVDDMSPDRVPEMCDDWAAKSLKGKRANGVYFPRIKVLHKEKNGGLSDARNYGIPHAEGEYIAFVDSDDYIAPNMFEKLYKAAKDSNADIVECEFEYVYEDTGKHTPVSFPTYRSKEDCLMAAYPNAWNKIYRRKWLESLSVVFPRGLWHEDIEFFFKVIPFANSVPVTIHEQLYFYRQRSGSIMSNPDRRILDLHKIYDNVITYYKEKGLYEDYKDVIEYKYLKTAFCSFLRRMLAIKDKKFRSEVIDDSWNLFNNAFPEWRKNPYLKQLLPINIYLRMMSKPSIAIMKLLVR